MKEYLMHFFETAEVKQPTKKKEVEMEWIFSIFFSTTLFGTAL